MNLKETYRDLSEKSTLAYRGYLAIHELKCRQMDKLDDVSFAKRMYMRANGKDLDLENPRTMDEKLWWLKFHYRNPLQTICSDKYKVREYVNECGLGDILNDLYGVYDRAEDVDFDALPSPSFVKCNKGSGTNMVYSRDRSLNRKHFNLKFNSTLDFDYSRNSREWNYKDIEPRIIAEKVLRCKDGSMPLDYKFMCFHGEPKLLFLDSNLATDDGRHNARGQRDVYDCRFVPVPVKVTREQSGFSYQKPMHFDDMLDVAQRLSRPFPFCRVDLYNLDGAIVFGEMTFFHNGGCNAVEPEEWDYKIGSWIDLEKVKNSEFYVGGGVRSRLITLLGGQSYAIEHRRAA